MPNGIKHVLYMDSNYLNKSNRNRKQKHIPSLCKEFFVMRHNLGHPKCTSAPILLYKQWFLSFVAYKPLLKKQNECM